MTQKLYSTPIDACTATGVEYPSRGLLPGPWNPASRQKITQSPETK